MGYTFFFAFFLSAQQKFLLFFSLQLSQEAGGGESLTAPSYPSVDLTLTGARETLSHLRGMPAAGDTHWIAWLAGLTTSPTNRMETTKSVCNYRRRHHNGLTTIK